MVDSAPPPDRYADGPGDLCRNEDGAVDLDALDCNTDFLNVELGTADELVDDSVEELDTLFGISCFGHGDGSLTKLFVTTGSGAGAISAS